MSLELWEQCDFCDGRGWTIATPNVGQLPKPSWCLRCHKTGKIPTLDGERLLRFLAEMDERGMDLRS